MEIDNMDKLEKGLAAALMTIIGFPLLFISLWYAHRLDVKISQQLGEIKKIAQSENSIALNTMQRSLQCGGSSTPSKITNRFLSKMAAATRTWSWTGFWAHLIRLRWCTATAF